jgi:hypothetical protein
MKGGPANAVLNESDIRKAQKQRRHPERDALPRNDKTVSSSIKISVLDRRD